MDDKFSASWENENYALNFGHGEIPDLDVADVHDNLWNAYKKGDKKEAEHWCAVMMHCIKEDL